MVPEVHFADSVKLRSQRLAQEIQTFLERTDVQSKKVHIITHSMGGLDARRMIVDVPGMAEKVATLTTIATPHLGSPAAADALRKAGG